MSDQENNSKTASFQTDSGAEPRNRKPLVFALALVVVALLAYGYKIVNHGIFACSADGYKDGWYFAYCNSTAYGDYDHGALWYPLEPESVSYASNAQVLMIGSSRMQYGFSTDSVDQWFNKRGISHYLLGFSHTETVKFVQPLLEKVDPQAKVIVINLDGFFENRVTEPVANIFAGGDSRSRYEAKRRWHRVHQFVCGAIPGLCSNSPSVYRNIETGRWIQYGNNPNWLKAPTGLQSEEQQINSDQDLILAQDFIRSIDQDGRCIILTIVPSPLTPMKKVEYLAQKLDMPLHVPTPTGYRTRDNSHLDIPSAELWSQAFLQLSGDEIERCLTLPTTIGQ